MEEALQSLIPLIPVIVAIIIYFFINWVLQYFKLRKEVLKEKCLKGAPIQEEYFKVTTGDKPRVIFEKQYQEWIVSNQSFKTRGDNKELIWDDVIGVIRRYPSGEYFLQIMDRGSYVPIDKHLGDKIKKIRNSIVRPKEDATIVHFPK